MRVLFSEPASQAIEGISAALEKGMCYALVGIITASDGVVFSCGKNVLSLHSTGRSALWRKKAEWKLLAGSTDADRDYRTLGGCLLLLPASACGTDILSAQVAFAWDSLGNP